MKKADIMVKERLSSNTDNNQKYGREFADHKQMIG